MGPRKCIYTGEDATSKDSVMSKKDEDCLHNWANRAPSTPEYAKNRKGRLPTELEMEANRIFYLLELAKLDVSYLAARLREVQEKITGKKQEEIEKSYHLKDLTESFEETVQEVLEKPQKFWDVD